MRVTSGDKDETLEGTLVLLLKKASSIPPLVFPIGLTRYARTHAGERMLACVRLPCRQDVRLCELL